MLSEPKAQKCRQITEIWIHEMMKTWVANSSILFETERSKSTQIALSIDGRPQNGAIGQQPQKSVSISRDYMWIHAISIMNS